MTEAWIIGLRGVQYGCGALLFGLPAFLLYSGRATDGLPLRWPRPLLTGGAVVLLTAAPAALVAQTALMAGSLEEAIKPDSLTYMITGMGLGAALALRALFAAFALGAAALLKPGRRLWTALAAAGGLTSASFAWTGHGAATEGDGRWLHLVADILHALAASLWIGALAAFVFLALWRPSRLEAPDRAQDRALQQALAGFAGIGTLAVGVLTLTGLANSAFLVGWDNLPSLTASPYGRLLAIKLGLFLAMLALAATNRFHLTPRMEGAPDRALSHLRASLLIEFGLGLAILVIVAVMGTLPPPAAL